MCKDCDESIFERIFELRYDSNVPNDQILKN